MPQFSANLGFLWTELALPDAIHAAKAAGFVAVEAHWPYDEDTGAVRAALAETGLSMLGINTLRGAPGENGLSALPGRGIEARAAIDQALDYARAIGAQNVHVMAGFASGPEAHDAFLEALRYASDNAGDIGILVEPLNPHDAPGYFLCSTDQAAGILRELNRDNVKLMFDCYHVGRMEGDVITRACALLPLIGHVQFAGVPARGRPDEGELNFDAIFAALTEAGWDAPLGAEYKPGGATEPTLGWMTRYA